MKYRSIAALAATAVVVLGACGDDDDTASSTSVAQVTTTAAAAAPTTAAGGASTTASALAPATEAAGATTEAAGSEAMSTEAMSTAGTMAAGSEAMSTEAMSTAGTMAAGSEAMSTEAMSTTGGGSTEPGGVPGSAVGGSIVVGSADFPESALLAEIYGQALAAAGTDVSYELNIGSREAYITAIEDGEIDLVPEYTGNLLAFLVAPEQPSAVTVDDQVAALADALPDGLEVLTPSSAEDKDTIVCTQDVVDAHNLTDLSSLFAVADQITLGAPPEFETRTPFGIKGFKDIYGATFKEFVPLASADIKDALSGGQIDCGNIFSTDPAITTDGFVALEDDQNIGASQAIVPLIRSEVVTPEVTATLDQVDAALDTNTLAGLVSEVIVDQRGPDEVAAEFLATMSGGGTSSAPAGSASTEAASTEAMSSTVPATTA